jgi:glycosyltransferase involved in cell wall biosynthesis
VIRLHGGTGLVLEYENHQHPKLTLAKRLEQQVVSRAALVTAPSKSVLEVSRGWLPVGNNASIIPNPVNTEMFSPNGGRPVESEPQIVCVGTPRYVKGLHVLVRAIPLVWQAHPEARFVFVAPLKSDQENEAFRAVLGDLYGHPKIELRSRVAHAGMPDIYRHATMCVVPSLWPEPFGYSCAEPMACGVPVVASRVGGLAEMITDGQTGVLVERDNATELAKAITGLLRNEAKRSDLGRQAREKINSDFSTQVIVPRMEAAYQRVCR